MDISSDQLKRIHEAFTAFLVTPSATNYKRLETAMLLYQAVWNTRRERTIKEKGYLGLEEKNGSYSLFNKGEPVFENVPRDQLAQEFEQALACQPEMLLDPVD